MALKGTADERDRIEAELRQIEARADELRTRLAELGREKVAGNYDSLVRVNDEEAQDG